VSLAKSTKVVLSLAGPFDKYGRNLVKACAENGTDYADITGEIGLFVKDSAKLEEAAKKTGARIVHCCGYDSVPADLLTRKIVNTLEKATKETAEGLVITSAADMDFTQGTASGGTIASILNMIESIIANPKEFSEARNPYQIGGAPEGWSKDKWSTLSDEKFPRYCTDLRSWVCPFIMAPCNTRVVRKSLAGKNSIYREVSSSQGAFGLTKCILSWFFISLFMVLLVFKPFRNFVGWIRPPGSGPTLKEQENGQWRYIISARTTGEKEIFIHGFAQAVN
jgi:short subunit dehydrogenase-like uncharacterized protein